MWTIVPAGSRTLDALSSALFSFRVPFSVYRREFHTINCECNEFCLLFECIVFSFTHPVFLVASSIPDESSIVPLPPMFPHPVVTRILFYTRCLRGLPPFRTSPSETCFIVSITGKGPSSQTHPMARHILSAITSYRKGIPKEKEKERESHLPTATQPAQTQLHTEPGSDRL